MRISSAVFSEFDDLVELWVELAADRRAPGSHLRAEANQTPMWEALTRRVAANDVLVARGGDVGDGGTEVGSGAKNADADGLVGFVMFGIKAGTYEQDATRGMVQNLFVRPAYRDTGVRTRLLAAVESTLADASVDAVALDVLADNEAARRFYRRHDYRPRHVELKKSMRSDIHSKEDG